jgi:glycosyltransferase involved in cell wall biosynthesis
MLISFFLPVYNEEKILEQNVIKLLKYCREQNFNFAWRIIITVNGSSDNSFALGKKLASANPGEITALNIVSPGRGNALKKAWLESEADILVYMDIDLAVSLEDINDLLKPLVQGDYDMAIGSRLLPESKISRSFIRELSSQTYNFLSKIILGHNFSDLQCGFKAIKIKAFKKIAPFIKDNKWFFDTELIILAHRFGFKIKEIPVNWEECRWEKRKSKVNLLRDSSKYIADLLKFKVRIAKITREFKRNSR